MLQCLSHIRGRAHIWPGLHSVSGLCPGPDDVRLAGGRSRCAGKLKVKYQGEWRESMFLSNSDSNLKSATVVCRQLGCGSVISTEVRTVSMVGKPWQIQSDCLGSEPALRECGRVMASDYSFNHLEVTCSGKFKLFQSRGDQLRSDKT